MKTLLWVLTIVGSLLGGFIVFLGVFATNGAPQEAAAAAIGVACAVIPYCIARAVSELSEPVESDKKLSMGLAPCPDCAKPVSLEAAICPRCGRLFKEN